MAPLVVHFLISLMLVVRAVSSTAQWNTLRPVDMATEEREEAVKGNAALGRRTRNVDNRDW